ncbi:hypothetical protein GCM10009679_41500 [Saccharothrix algeriensis]|uniref:Uncharacterized protein n=1 Tax=Catellatospora bangladeshensis TaxID=310355 RepID=A0A8J3JMP7_9ACTN|nr:hypothetical protein Cba03nite_47570 [Catellatospora bangladeshensis]
MARELESKAATVHPPVSRTQASRAGRSLDRTMVRLTGFSNHEVDILLKR